MLPITLVIPTLNNRKEIGAHIESLRPVAEQAGQLVLVDSRSTDGTWEALREGLPHPNRICLRPPPGLYAAWNLGVAKADQPWLTFATVSDTITLDGLRHLHETAEQHAADLVISPPKMLRPDGTRSDARWPIHEFCETFHGSRASRLLGPAEIFLGFCTRGVQSIIGSSASNLYRTAFLHQHPFPEDFGHLGDTAWAVRNGLAMRVAVTPVVCSAFVHEERQMRLGELEHARYLERLAAEGIAAAERFGAQQPESGRILLFAAQQNRRFIDWVIGKVQVLEKVLREAEELRTFTERLENDRQLKLELIDRLTAEVRELSRSNASLHAELGRTQGELQRLSSLSNLAREKVKRLFRPAS